MGDIIILVLGFIVSVVVWYVFQELLAEFSAPRMSLPRTLDEIDSEIDRSNRSKESK